MCDYGAALNGALGIGGQLLNYKGAKDNWKAEVAAKKQEATNIIRSTNYQLQDFEINRNDNFDAAIMEIMKVQQSARSLNASVSHAVQEDQGDGRTASMITRSTLGDTARTTDSIKDNYGRLSNEIDLNKERTLMGANQQLDGIKISNKPSLLPYLLNSASIGLNAYTNGMDRKYDALSKGADWSFWKGATKKDQVPSTVRDNVKAQSTRGGY